MEDTVKRRRLETITYDSDAGKETSSLVSLKNTTILSIVNTIIVNTAVTAQRSKII